MSSRPPAVDNVLFVVIDALRAEHVGAYEGGALTPNLDALAEDGEVFDRCFSCINMTDASLTTMMTGQFPTRHGVLNQGSKVTEEEREYVASTNPLPARLQDTHTTLAFDLLKRWHKRGFDKYIQPREQTTVQKADIYIEALPDSVEELLRWAWATFATEDHSEREWPPIKAKPLTDDIVNEVSGRDDGWFALGHYWDVHLPYIPLDAHDNEIQNLTFEDGDRPLEDLYEDIEGSHWEEQLRARSGDAETVGEMNRKYAAGLKTVDEQLGRLVEHLKREGIYEDTAIIVTGDHGESLTEHGIYYEHHGLYDQSLHVPMIIKAPGFEGREDAFVQHFDLAPTVLDLLGQGYDAEEFDGESLSPSNRPTDREAAYAIEAKVTRKRAIRTDQYKFIKRLDKGNPCDYCGTFHGDDKELFDIGNDPEELNNIHGSNAERSKQLEKMLDEWIESRPSPRPDVVDFSVDEDVKETLRQMGYK